MSIRVMVVDDEPLARRRILSLLAGEDGVEVVGESGDGRGAVDAIAAAAPDLVFLDVQMPELDGFGVVRALPPERLPVVVFVTAFDRYALQAFEVHALDYLLKPYKPERLREALRRARRHLELARPEMGRQTAAVAARTPLPDAEADALPAAPAPEAGERHLTRILVKDGGKLFFVRVAEVDYFESESNYLRMHVGKKSWLVRGRINVLERRLPPEQFLRIHRSTIVNLDRIKEVHPWFGGDYIVTLADGTQLKLSRTYRHALASGIC